MLQSMTGYGKANGGFRNKSITVEIRTLNSKQIDLNLKLSPLYREKEIDFRNALINKLTRGKIEFLLYSEQTDQERAGIINREVFDTYYQQIQSIAKDKGIACTDTIIPAILRLPDVLKNEKEELTDEEWLIISSIVENAIDQVILFRKQEGEALDKDMRNRIDLISKYLEEIEPYEANRIEHIKSRIKNNLLELENGNKTDPDRFEQELIYYLEKIDITEEKVRLTNHLTYFIETMETSEGIGKKLSFISQEIGREINTIGSKASDSNIQKLVVQMKDELEKIKEQLMNVL